MSDKLQEKSISSDHSQLPKFTSDFQCFVCGALFTTDEDRRQHLQKEILGRAREPSETDDIQIAKNQQHLNDSHHHYI